MKVNCGGSRLTLDLHHSVATSDVWTGLNDLEYPGYFIWSDKHNVKFTYWAPGEPDNHLGFHEDCVEMYHQVWEERKKD